MKVFTEGQGVIFVTKRSETAFVSDEVEIQNISDKKAVSLRLVTILTPWPSVNTFI